MSKPTFFTYSAERILALWKNPLLMLIAAQALYLILGMTVLEFTVTIWDVLAAIAAAVLTEWACSRKVNFPPSAVAAALGIGIFFRAANPFYFVFAACLAIASKYVIKVRGSHVFNPSNFGVVVSVFLFPSAAAIELMQWGENLYVFALVAVLSLIIAYRAGAIVTTISFFVSYTVLLTLLVPQSFFTFAVHHYGILGPSFVLFASFMITDPKTSPQAKPARILHGLSVALAFFLLELWSFQYPLFVASFVVAFLNGAGRFFAFQDLRFMQKFRLPVNIFSSVVIAVTFLCFATPLFRVQAKSTNPVTLQFIAFGIDSEWMQDYKDPSAPPPTPDSLAVKFTDVTRAAGLTYVQRQSGGKEHCAVFDPRHPKGECAFDEMTGGATVGDYNNDGWPDIYVTRVDGTGVLYKNMGDGTFTDVTAEAGLSGAVNGNGALFADLNNDGYPELYITVVGKPQNYLYINDGKGHFTEEAAARGADSYSAALHGGESVSAGDYDGDGWLDLYITDWRVYFPTSPVGAVLLKNKGGIAPGFFTDVTQAAGVGMGDFSQHGSLSFSSTFADLDGDGHPDLAITSDYGTSRLFWNNGNGTFTDGTKEAGVGTDKNGMGSAIGDVNGDGLLDWFVTAIYSPNTPCNCDDSVRGNRLYQNEGNRTFTDVTDAKGVRNGGWGWGAAWIDADNAGKLDLVMTNGEDYDMDMSMGSNNTTPKKFDDTAPLFNTGAVASSGFVPNYEHDPMRLWYNNGGGKMIETASHAGLTDDGLGKGLITLDYNNDGRMDIFVVDNAGMPHLYRNDTPEKNGWLKVRVLTQPNGRDALNAVVTVTNARGQVQVRQVGVNSSFLGQSEDTLLFGLGQSSAPVQKVEVSWPWLHKTKVYTNVAQKTTLVAVPQ